MAADDIIGLRPLRRENEKALATQQKNYRFLSKDDERKEFYIEVYIGLCTYITC